MKLERGHVYEVGDGWKYLRLLSCFQEYESFNPDIVDEQYVRVIKVDDDNIDTPRPFRMKRGMFEDLVIEDHGFHTPDEPSEPSESHKPLTTTDDE